MSWRRLSVAALLSTTLYASPAAAEPTAPVRAPQRERTILLAGQEQARLLADRARIAGQQATQAPPRRSFIKRHPVLTGMVIGMGVGSVIEGATAGSEAAFVGFYGGGLIGGAAGWALSR